MRVGKNLPDVSIVPFEVGVPILPAESTRRKVRLDFPACHETQHGFPTRLDGPAVGLFPDCVVDRVARGRRRAAD